MIEESDFLNEDHILPTRHTIGVDGKTESGFFGNCTTS